MNSKGIDLKTHPDAILVQKKPAPVQVRFTREKGYCNTLEGRVPYVEGDAILTGPEGENWPVSRAYFDASYDSVNCKPGQPGAYIKRPRHLLALKLRQPTVLTRCDGSRLSGVAGDWLVEYGPDDQAIVKASIFLETYEFL